MLQYALSRARASAPGPPDPGADPAATRLDLPTAWRPPGMTVPSARRQAKCPARFAPYAAEADGPAEADDE